MKDVLDKNKGISWQDFGGGMIILNPNKEKVHQLNSVAMDIFELINGENSLMDIKDALMEKYEIEEQTLVCDMDQFIVEAKSLGIIN